MNNKTKFTDLRIEPYMLNMVEIEDENPLPIFKTKNQDLKLRLSNNIPEDEKRFKGWQIGYRVLPYNLQDVYSRKLKQKVYDSVVLENDYIKSIFLPQLGGRLMSLLYKPDKKELLDHNIYTQLSNLALRKAWFSGGIEWNLAQYGHHYLTASPIFAARIIGFNGEPALRFYEWDRCKNIAWQIDFYLPPDSKFLYAHIKTINTNNFEIPMYWWTTVAVPETEDSRVICPANDCIFLDPTCEEFGFDYSKLPNLKFIDNKDITFPFNSPCATSTFFRIHEDQRKWIAALNSNGKGIIEVSTKRLLGRKVFFWGTHQGGRHWQRFLSPPRENGYFEIQMGLAKTQEECIPMPARTSWNWTQAFGYFECNPGKTHGGDWKLAYKEVDKQLSSTLPEDKFEDLHKEFTALENHKIVEVLNKGSAWGQIELMRIKKSGEENLIPESMAYSESSISKDQEKWVHLLKNGYLIPQKPEERPGSWMIHPGWMKLLEESVKNKDGNNWYTWLHLGVIYFENDNLEKAEIAWKKSIDFVPSCWAYRNLAHIEKRKENLSKACDYILKAWEVAVTQKIKEVSLAAECLDILYESKKYDEALKLYGEFPEEFKKDERILILRGKFALEKGQFDILSDILKKDFAHVDEKGTVLVDLWYKMWEAKRAKELGLGVSTEIKNWVKENHPHPSRIDFITVEDKIRKK